jgi:hypothetical protein
MIVSTNDGRGLKPSDASLDSDWFSCHFSIPWDPFSFQHTEKLLRWSSKPLESSNALVEACCVAGRDDSSR